MATTWRDQQEKRYEPQSPGGGGKDEHLNLGERLFG
jgi:hypothetical protein